MGCPIVSKQVESKQVVSKKVVSRQFAAKTGSLTETVDVVPGEQVFANLPKTGVLRFARKGAAMAGPAALVAEDGALALHFADGASLYVNHG